MRVRDLGVLIKREPWRERSGESERSRGLNKERDMERKKR